MPLAVERELALERLKRICDQHLFSVRRKREGREGRGGSAPSHPCRWRSKLWLRRGDGAPKAVRVSELEKPRLRLLAAPCGMRHAPHRRLAARRRTRR